MVLKILLFTAIAFVVYVLADKPKTNSGRRPSEATPLQPQQTTINQPTSQEGLFMSDDFDISDLVDRSKRRNI